LTALEAKIVKKKFMTKSLEDYLEAIHRQISKTGSARVVDVANMLDVKMPSVNNAVKELAKLGLVKYERYREIQITEKGKQKAAAIYERHKLLKTFLLSIGVSEKNAETDACAMEHILSSETLGRLREITEERPDID
jgi:DtxR family Mn-dependent transcriptional regulator